MKMPPRTCLKPALIYTSTHHSPLQPEKKGNDKSWTLTWIYSSAQPMWQPGWSNGHVHAKNWCCGLESFTMASSLWCLWQDGITHPDWSMTGTIWVHSFTVTSKLHSLYILCMFETTQMNWLQKGSTETIPLTIPEPWSDSPFLQHKPCNLG